jgi:hypothetical protein
MLKRTAIRLAVLSVSALTLTAATLLWQSGQLEASDHFEAPLVQADPSMDITDLYLFAGAAGKTVAVIDYAGLGFSLTQPTSTGTYNANALYTLHIDNTGDDVEDTSIYVRFGQNSLGAWGVKVDGLPGAGSISGAVETNLSDGSGNKVFAGRRDDPFFFDAQGYLDTLATGTLMITNTRDFLAGMNCTSIVLEFDTAAALDGGTRLSCWATAGRK